MKTQPISRRTFLRGLGVALALPCLEAMCPGTIWGDDDPPAAKTIPKRMAYIYVPNGKNMVDWTPTTEGAGYAMPAILDPLKDFRDDFLVLSGLTADKARANGDGGDGNHTRAQAAFLTGAQPRRTGGSDIRAGISVDQVAAASFGDQVRQPSLELCCEEAPSAGSNCGSYSCVYCSTLAWRSATQPQPMEINPKLVFDRLFTTGSDGERAQQEARRRCVLDLVRQDVKDLSGKLGVADQRKLDDYVSSIREIETRIERAAKLPPVKTPDYPEPKGIPASYEEHIRQMCDLLVLAFQADVTRISTFLFAHEGSNKSYAFAGVPEGHHDISHHGGDEAKKAKIRQINRFHTTQLAYLLGKLKAIKEGDGTLLDHCMIAYGSGIADGDLHNHENLPVLLAGRGGGTIKPGRHIRYPAETPLNNLWVGMLERTGVDCHKLGDSTGSLNGLS